MTALEIDYMHGDMDAPDDIRWRAVQARDAEADGGFVYSVKSTGVYCRPSCAARPALRRNVAFHDTPSDAEQAGFRPCKRCRPDLPPKVEREAALVAAACRVIEASDEAPELAVLARGAGLSPHHFHRLFKRVAGVTPKAYFEARRSGRAREALADGAGVTEALYAAGYNSSGRFYEAAPAMLGMTPSAYRAGGAGQRIGYAFGRSSLGEVLVAATHRGVCAILLGDDRDLLQADLRGRFPKAALSPLGPEAAAWVTEAIAVVDDPFKGAHSRLPLDIQGTAFQQRVWQALRDIPPGQTDTYGGVAARLGVPGASRAVGAACGRNPLAVIVPCHRVVAASGDLTGYRWGVERKRALLRKERG